MKPITHFVLLAVVFMFVFSTCKKDEGTTSTQKTKKELLTANSWGLKSLKINGVATEIATCQKDDILTFLVNGTYSQNPNGTFCNSYDKLITGTWTLSGDEKSIICDGNSVLTILELTTSKLVIYMGVGSNNTETTLIPLN